MKSVHFKVSHNLSLHIRGQEFIEDKLLLRFWKLVELVLKYQFVLQRKRVEQVTRGRTWKLRNLEI